jgi:hypothetical protein
MSKRPENPAQTSLGFVPRFDPLALKKALRADISACPLSRDQIAERMRSYTGCVTPTRATIDAWTADSKPTHLPSVDDIEAFIYVTGQHRTAAAIVAPARLSIIGPADAELLAIAKLQEARAALDQELEQRMTARARVTERTGSGR